MADEVRIDKLSIEIETNSGEAAKQIDALGASLKKIKGISPAKEFTEGTGNLKKTTEEVSKSVSGIKSKFAAIAKASKSVFSTIVSGTKKASSSLLQLAGAPFKKLSNAFKGITGKFKNFFTMFKKRLMYRFINSIISAIQDGFKTGLENVYQYSKLINGPLASSLDRITTAFLYFKNSIGAAVAPLVNMLAPAIDYVIDKAVELLNTVNQLFARLSGASTWTKAIRYPKEYAAAADDAKKANEDLKKTILGFDQLNVLQDNSKSDSSKSKENDDYSKMFEEVELANKKGVFSDLFSVFKKAWDNEGQNTIDAIKHAFESVRELIDSIKKSFKEVWENGTGQQTVETVLKIFQNIFNTIGNIADRLKTAWDGDGAGTRIVQGLWDILNSILGTIEKITKSTEEWAATLDFSPLLTAIDGFLQSLKPVIDDIGDVCKWIWDNIIEPITKWAVEEVLPAAIDVLSGALDVLHSVLEKVQPALDWLWDNILKPIAEWTGDLFVKALQEIADLLEDISNLINGETSFKDFIDGLTPVQTAIVAIGTALGIVIGVLAAVGAAMAVASAATAVFGAVMAVITSPIFLVVAAIAAVIAIAILVVKHWDDIKEAGKKAWEAIKKAWEKAGEWFDKNILTPIKDFFKKAWDKISTTASDCWEAIKKFFQPAIDWFSKLFGSVWQTIKDVFHNVEVIAKGCWEIIKVIWGVVKDWFNKNVVQPVGNFFKKMWDGIKTAAQTAWNGIRTLFAPAFNWFNNSIVQPLTRVFTTLWDTFKRKASDAWDGVKQVFSRVATFFHDTFSNAWQGIVRVFSTGGQIFHDIKEGVLSGFKWVVNQLINGINNVVAVPFRGINSVLSWLKNISIAGLTPFSGITEINIPQIPTLAQGGMVNAGTMFIAGEAGAEVVANIGNRTGVMNTDEMSQSVQQGILNATGSLASAIASALIRANGQGGTAPTVEVTVKADSETLYKTVKKGEKYYNNRYHVVVGV